MRINTEAENLLYNVAWLRQHYGISKRKMAKLLNISIWNICCMEKGKLLQNIDVSVLFRIQDLFGIPPKDLLVRRLGENSNTSVTGG